MTGCRVPERPCRPPCGRASYASCRRRPPGPSCPTWRRCTTAPSSRSRAAARTAAASARPASSTARCASGPSRRWWRGRGDHRQHRLRRARAALAQLPDYRHIEELLERLLARFGDQVAISLPSLRVDTFSLRLAERVQGAGDRPHLRPRGRLAAPARRHQQGRDRGGPARGAARRLHAAAGSASSSTS